jgi:hypothetical protein
MATLRQRDDKWQADINKAGYARKSKTFKTKSAAKAWARKVEMQMDEGTFIDDKEIISHKLSGLTEN